MTKLDDDKPSLAWTNGGYYTAIGDTLYIAHNIGEHRSRPWEVHAIPLDGEDPAALLAKYQAVKWLISAKATYRGSTRTLLKCTPSLATAEALIAARAKP